MNNPIEHIRLSCSFFYGYTSGVTSRTQAQNHLAYQAGTNSTIIFVLSAFFTILATKKIETVLPFTFGYIAGFTTADAIINHSPLYDHTADSKTNLVRVEL